MAVCPSFSSLPVHFSVSLSYTLLLIHFGITRLQDVSLRPFSFALSQFLSFSLFLFHPMFLLRPLFLSFSSTRNETRVERKWERVGADKRTRKAEGRDCGTAAAERRRGQTSRSDGRGGEEETGEREWVSAGARGDSIMMQRWRGGGTLELARALAIGRSANHSFGNNRLHTLHTKDTRETAKNCPEWGCSRQGSDDVVHSARPGREVSARFAFLLARDEGWTFFFRDTLLDNRVRASCRSPWL